MNWLQVPGTHSASLFELIRRPDVLSCNSYLIQAPDWIVAIDPGGLQSQTRILLEIVKGLLEEKRRPVLICLTHCHADHSLEALRHGAWRDLPDVTVAIHAAGAEALLSGDRRITQAEILGAELPLYEPGRRLFTRQGADSEVIPLGGQDVLEAYPTPGHSPDGVCFRMGNFLFIGDLLVAVAPLIAGVPGWNCEELASSLQTVLRLIRHHRIAICYPGHGPPLIGEAIEPAFRAALEETKHLSEIEVADARRVRQVSDSAQALFAELGNAFTVIYSRIERLAEKLRGLEEFSAAKEIRMVLDSEQVSQLLLQFRNFHESFRAGETIEAQVAQKAIQVVFRISRLMGYGGLDQAVDPSLLRLTRTLLKDFLQAARGLKLTEEKEELDLNVWLDLFRKELIRVPGQGIDLENIPDDPEGFRDYMIRTLSQAPVFRETAVTARFIKEARTITVVEPRFHDALKRMLEDMAEGGAKTIDLSFEGDQQGPRLEIRVEFRRPIFNIGESRLKPYSRIFETAGAVMNVNYQSWGLEIFLRPAGPPAGKDPKSQPGARRRKNDRRED